MKIKTKTPQATFTMRKKPKSLKMKKTKVKAVKKGSDNLQLMSVSDFMSGGFEDIDENSSSSVNNTDEANLVKKTKVKKSKLSVGVDKKEKKVKKKTIEGQKKTKKATKLKEDENLNSENEDSGDESTNLKEKLQNLQNTDPEFYKFLKANDGELLNFEDSDDSDNEESQKNKYHVPPNKLEVGSDESDFEAEDEEVGGHKKSDKVLTVKIIKKWQKDIKTDKSNKTLLDLIEAFHAALARVAPDRPSVSAYQVDDPNVFNAVIRACVADVEPALRFILKLPSGSREHPTKCKAWTKVKSALRMYVTDLAELTAVTSPAMLSVLLKHIHQMSTFIVCYPNLCTTITKRVVQLWASNEDVVRVLSFLVLLRIANKRPTFLSTLVKRMYMTYVRNTKFVSPNTLPGINFMRRSLAEMFALDDTLTYQHAFLYIRQLAIHLRNAVTLKKKESYQAVHNWQYLSSIYLWSEVLSLLPPTSPIRPLLYPLVQITLGALKLIPSPQYFPLRFHCLQILTGLSDKTGVFIPILPFLIEILRDFNLNRKHQKVSMKPMDFTTLLRCSRSQMQENGFKDSVVENIYVLFLEYLVTECHRLSFPDLVVPTVIQLKQFLKTCKMSNYCKKMKTILDKIQENAKFIENERKNLTIRLDDVKGVEAVELGLKLKKPPLQIFYDSWKKIHLQTQAKKMTNNDSMGDLKIPVIYKMDRKRSREQSRMENGMPELFPSDSEDDDTPDLFNDEDDVDKEPKTKKKKSETEVKQEKREKQDLSRKPKKYVKLEDNEEEFGDDVVEDLNLSDLE